MASKWNYGKKTIASHIFDSINISFMFFLMVITLYPFLYVLFASISNPMRMMGHTGLLLGPLGVQFDVYKMVLANKALRNGYLVTLFVVIVGTACNMTASLLFAYVLSRKIMLRRLITFLAIFTMYFSGGMIPTYLVVRAIGLIDSLWAMILPNLIGTYYVIILRTAFNSIPVEMEESAKLDGAGSVRTLAVILIPLIVPSIAAITLFYMVNHWNAWSQALVYIRTPEKYPVQLVLRSILLQNETTSTGTEVFGYESGTTYALRQLVKYCTVMVTIIPIICVYPFLQKFFTKGVMIGAIKG